MPKTTCTNNEIHFSISVEVDQLHLDVLSSTANERGLRRKSEFHITIVGFQTSKIILNILRKNPDQNIESMLLKINTLVKSFEWKFRLLPEYYFITKTYKHPRQPTPEIRSSIIQIIDIPDMKLFYEKLSSLLRINIDLPLPHITLYSASTDPEFEFAGIGIYTERQFWELSPEKILID